MTTRDQTMAVSSNGKGFWALIATQFQGAFNDNLYRFVIVFYMIHHFAPSDETLHESYSMTIVALATVLFSIPFLLFPGIAGALSDRYSKRTISIATKVWEIGVMVLALVAFIIGNPALIFVLLFLMFTQSTFFSPSKYGILPEILPESRLSWGNGIMGMTTFIAIIAGQAIAGFLYEQVRLGELSLTIISALLIGLSGAGLACSFGITKTAAANPQKQLSLNLWAGLGRYFKLFYQDTVLWLILLGGAYFWMAGALVQGNVLVHGKSTLEQGEFWSTTLVISVLLGIGLGSAAAGYWSRGKIELGLVPIGLLGMALSGLVLGLVTMGYWATFVLLLALGFFAGFFIIPIMATVQNRAPKDLKGGMIATFNIGTCIGVLLGGGLFMAAGQFGVNTYQVFIGVAILTLLVGLYLCLAFPVFIIRSVMWFFINTFYRLKVLHPENIPQEGGALFVANHTSFIDALFLMVSIDRPIRFMVAADIHESRWIGPLARMMKAIPISPMSGPRDLVQSIREASEAIKNGEIVCIFAEGQISRTGNTLPFRKGYEKIVKGVDAPIIPIHLDQLWGSIFSFSEGKFFWKWPKRIPYPVTVNFGAPLSASTTPFKLYCTIRELGTEAYCQRKLASPLLHRGFIRLVRRHPFRFCLADANIQGLSYFKTLVASIIFGRKLKALLDDQPMVGVLVPPTVGGALTNIALQIMGKTPVNLNYTASADALESAAKQCNITQVLTARALLERLPVTVPGESIFLEDVKASVKGSDRIVALLMALFLPARCIERALGCKQKRSQDELATIIFSSGSEGDPKGVPLTHFNVSSNIEATMQVFPHEDFEIMVGMLPFFHSFGFMATLWLPLITGFGVVYHPSPLEAKAIGGLIYKHKCTFLVAAPTFLQNFIRRCLPEELSSIRHVITGAEKLPARIRDAFNTKFGVEPLEGYGTTECSPVVSVNIPDFRAPGYYQIGTKHGTIGQPIPGVSARVYDQESSELLPENMPGVLHVTGPNIMSGYLHLPEKTADVLKDGWYNTGDVAAIDEDGFITITDRVSRFSKIAGEMVPHTRVEETLHSLLELTDMSMAVTGLPDTSKGERLVVLHTLEDEQLDALFAKLDKSDLPKLWTPRANAFYKVEAIPVLGTGKLDLRGVKQLAKQLDTGEENGS